MEAFKRGRRLRQFETRVPEQRYECGHDSGCAWLRIGTRCMVAHGYMMHGWHGYTMHGCAFWVHDVWLRMGTQCMVAHGT
eukprot:353643-Chlamydomonas_euryale.AAC.12